MFIKPKSIIVVVLSSIVISFVLIFTLIGYYMYIELKARETEMMTLDALKKIQSKIFSKYVEVSQLSCEAGLRGAARRALAIKGVIKNRSARPLHNIVLKVKFLDTSGALIYEVVFPPLEPTFGIDQVGRITKSYLLGAKKDIIKPTSSVPFKRVIPNFPKELLASLSSSKKDKKVQLPGKTGAWFGSLTAELISVEP